MQKRYQCCPHSTVDLRPEQYGMNVDREQEILSLNLQFTMRSPAPIRRFLCATYTPQRPCFFCLPPPSPRRRLLARRFSCRELTVKSSGTFSRPGECPAM